ncbi:hypothetical protein [Trichlorobacter lovleyi]|nr:hypothetical protein [Trichlorobacter lovleyi]
MKRNIVTLFLFSLALLLPMQAAAYLPRAAVSTQPLKKTALVVIN